ncbi:MAG TPA: FmdB family zinc ribbon protein [Jiangellaceae bacterium]
MPTYQYRCADCGAERDVVQSFSDDALTVCPVCEGQFRKVFSAVGVVFKGSGFYRTDSRTSSTPSGNGTSKNGSESSSSESSTGSDTKSTGSESKAATKESGSTAKQPSTV